MSLEFDLISQERGRLRRARARREAADTVQAWLCGAIFFAAWGAVAAWVAYGFFAT
jgi:hypothetical protein